MRGARVGRVGVGEVEARVVVLVVVGVLGVMSFGAAMLSEDAILL